MKKRERKASKEEERGQQVQMKGESKAREARKRLWKRRERKASEEEKKKKSKEEGRERKTNVDERRGK